MSLLQGDSLLLKGDCLQAMKALDDSSVDLIFCDLPYGQTSCKWDIIVPWEPFWEEIMRVKKVNTPVFFTTTTKFGVEIINNCPKKCPFRYDIVWVKSTSAGFLCAKKMPMRKHEMVYVFYEKLPFYDLSSHQNKFIKKEETGGATGYNTIYNNSNKTSTPITKHPVKGQSTGQPRYDPPLPVSVVKEDKHTLYGEVKELGVPHTTTYDPPLPNSLLEIKSTRGKHSTEKPVALMEWILKYYSKEGDIVLDPTMGSGSTGVACKNMNRKFIGIEKDDEIYEVAVNRLNHSL